MEDIVTIGGSSLDSASMTPFSQRLQEEADR